MSDSEGLMLQPEDGSKEQQRAERLVARGMLERLPGGAGYAIPNQSFRI